MIMDRLNDILNTNENETSLRAFCLFVKDFVYEIDTMSINQIAQGAHASKGQISKCVRQLGYENLSEFKEDCEAYKESLTRKKWPFKNGKTLAENICDFTNQYTTYLENTIKQLEYDKIEFLTQDILKSNYIYLYGHGDVRGNCYNIQREMKYLNKSVLILDEKLIRDYTFHKNDLLIVFSTNGQLFEYEKRRIKKLQAMAVNKWLITCNDKLEFCIHQLYIPSQDHKFNELIMSYVCNLLIMNLQAKQESRKVSRMETFAELL